MTRFALTALFGATVAGCTLPSFGAGQVSCTDAGADGGVCFDGWACIQGYCYPDASFATIGSVGGTTGSTAASGTASTTSSAASAAATGTGTGTGSSTGSAISAGVSTGSSSGMSGTGMGSSSGGAAFLDAGYCVIDGGIYPANTPSPTSLCAWCLPYVSSSAWSPLPSAGQCGADAGGCTIDAGGTLLAAAPYQFPLAAGTNPQNGCEACLPKLSSSAWSVLDAGQACGSGHCGGDGVCGCSGQCVLANTCFKNDLYCGESCASCPSGQLCVDGSCANPAALGTARSNLALAQLTYNESGLMAIGGRNDAGPQAVSEFLYASGSTSAWTIVAPLQTPRYALTATVAANLVFAMGGLGAGDATLDSVETMDGSYPSASDTWSPGAPLLLPVSGAATPPGTFGSGLDTILIGGTLDSGIPTLQIQELAAGSTAWAQYPNSLPVPLSGALAIQELGHATVPNGTLVFGGVDVDGGVSTSIWFLAQENPTGWSKLSSSWTNARSGFGGAVDGNGLVYLVGGSLPDGGVSNALDIYDPYTGAWSQGPALPTARTNLACAYLADGERIYCVGGYNGNFLDAVEAFLLNTGTWAHQ